MEIALSKSKNMVRTRINDQRWSKKIQRWKPRIQNNHKKTALKCLDYIMTAKGLTFVNCKSA